MVFCAGETAVKSSSIYTLELLQFHWIQSMEQPAFQINMLAVEYTTDMNSLNGSSPQHRMRLEQQEIKRLAQGPKHTVGNLTHNLTSAS